MKINVTALMLCACTFAFSQDSSDLIAENDLSNDISTSASAEIDKNGFNFDIIDARVNSKYSEFSSRFSWRNSLWCLQKMRLFLFTNHYIQQTLVSKNR